MREIRKITLALHLPDNETGDGMTLKLIGIPLEQFKSERMKVCMSNTEGWYYAMCLKAGIVNMRYTIDTIIRKRRTDAQWWIGFYRGYVGLAS